MNCVLMMSLLMCYGIFNPCLHAERPQENMRRHLLILENHVYTLENSQHRDDIFLSDVLARIFIECENIIGILIDINAMFDFTIQGLGNQIDLKNFDTDTYKSLVESTYVGLTQCYAKPLQVMNMGGMEWGDTWGWCLHGVSFDEVVPDVNDGDCSATTNNNKILTQLPPRIRFGVTLSLAGGVLIYIPEPMCKTAGKRLLEAGIMIALDGYLNHMDDMEK